MQKWISEEELPTIANGLIASRHPDLSDKNLILWAFQEKGNILFSIKKADPIWVEALSSKEPSWEGCRFVATINHDMWENYNDLEREAVIDDILCHLTFEEKEDKKTKQITVVWKILKPDFQGMLENLSKYKDAHPLLNRVKNTVEA